MVTSKTSIRALLLISAICSTVTVSQNKDLNLPDLGDRVSGVVSGEQERIIGRGFLEQVYAQAPIINDPVIQEYSELLIYRLSETSQVKDRQFSIVLIDDSSLNAFAAPGGVIGINGGLFLNANNEAQFSSVLGHELAHLSQRHFARNILRGQDTSLASSLIMISSLALAVISNNPTAFSIGPAALAQQRLRYSRIFEREADRYGFNNLVAAGYDPASMGEMFENMGKIRRLSGDNPPEFLLTHPVSSSRVSDAFNAADQLEISDGKKDSLNFQLIKGLLQARYMSKSPQGSIRYFQKLYEEEPSNKNHYSYIIALKLNGDFSEAIKEIEKLLTKFPKNIILTIGKAEILLDAKQYKLAIQQIDKVLVISPGNYPASFIKAKILSASSKGIAAESILRDLLISRNRDPNLWLQLSEIQRAAKNIAGYHLSRGEYYTLLGDAENALNQFQFALKIAGNSFQISETIMTKIQSSQERLKEQRGL